MSADYGCAFAGGTHLVMLFAILFDLVNEVKHGCCLASCAWYSYAEIDVW